MDDELTPENFWSIIAAMPKPPPVYYRLYYEDSGMPLFYSHEHQPGKYIEITPEQYALRDLKVRVINGVLVPYQPPTPKLRPSDTGTPCYPSDVAIVVNIQNKHQKWKFGTNE